MPPMFICKLCFHLPISDGQESQSDDSSLDEYDSDDSLPQKQEKSRLKNPQSSKAHLLNKLVPQGLRLPLRIKQKSMAKSQQLRISWK
ncbi:hypothetical protein EB796_008985 [Bugula neritina]|uniref:Uncharacterized protein n=1 Tax=Bugula neritina TaxID=10212 RepID=A0A7J7K3D9_BUGNE|nr:hypothetical protein EB796_008985 [Bugula neritina]